MAKSLNQAVTCDVTAICSKNADKEMCAPEKPPYEPIRGLLIRRKARNPLERLVAYQDDVPRFVVDGHEQFSDGRAENDIRMTRIQQKISGYFGSMAVRCTFRRASSHLSICRERDV